MADVVIRAEHLGFKSGNNFIVNDIVWTVRQGEHWVLFGLNGSGKTTLLSLLTGYRNYTHGDLQILGQRYNAENILALRKRIGWVSSSYFEKYYTKESVLDIILSGKFATLGLDYGITDNDIHKAKELLTDFRLKNVISHPFHLLSNGERQCVLTVRALMAKPDILIMDEPCAGLDIFSREYLINLITEVARKTGVTLIFVTHYTEEIKPEFEHCLLLREGKVYASGFTKEIFTDAVISDFIRCPVTVTWHDNQLNTHLEVNTSVEQWIARDVLPV